MVCYVGSDDGGKQRRPSPPTSPDSNIYAPPAQPPSPRSECYKSPHLRAGAAESQIEGAGAEGVKLRGGAVPTAKNHWLLGHLATNDCKEEEGEGREARSSGML